MRDRLPKIFSAFSLLFLLAAIAACSSDDGPTGGGGTEPPIPQNADMSIRFTVYQEGDQARLLWTGTAEGPHRDDSPQQSANPLIPGAEPFRVEWELVDGTVPILGFQYRATQDPREGDLRLPLDENDQLVWGDVTSFSYANSTPIEMIDTRCPSGGDCPEILLFTSDTIHSLWVFAATADGQETTLEEAQLSFEIVNEAPTTQLVEDGTYPYWYPSGGSPTVFSSGDTIPAGAKVVFKLAGQDPDPVVLKMPTAKVRFQGRYVFNERSGPQRELSTFYSEPAETDTVEFVVAPFSYTFFGRAVDRLRATDPTPVSFQFDVGFAPSMVSVFPGDVDEILLRNPAEGTWPQNTVDYGMPLTSVSRWMRNGILYDFEVSDAELWVGTIFRIPLELVGQADPMESPADGFGGARSFAYEWIGENDPENTVNDGDGFDDLGFFSDASAVDRYRLEDETGIEIFVPNLFWQLPQFFEEDGCAGAGNPAYCEMGELLRKQLGQITLSARPRHTARHQQFHYWSEAAEGQGSELSIDVDEWGLMGEVMSSSFSLRIGLDDGGGGINYWPPQP